MEKKYNQSELSEIINATFDESNFPMFWCDGKRFIMFNKSFEALTGYSRDELLNKGLGNLHHPENSVDDITQVHSDERVREPKVLNWFLKSKSGQKKLIELRLTRFFLNGDRSNPYFYGVCRPLDPMSSEEVFSESIDKLKESLAAAKQGIWEWVSHSDRAFFDDRFVKLTPQGGSTRGFSHNDFLERVHPQDRSRVGLTWKYTLEQNKDRYEDEYRILNYEDRYIWVRSIGKVTEKSTQNRILRIRGVIRDIHEEKQKEVYIHQQTQKLVNYAFMNSHLLRGPASSIIGLVDLLSESYDPELIEKLKLTADRLDEIIHEINDLISGSPTEITDHKMHFNEVMLIRKNKLKNLILKTSLEESQKRINLKFHQDEKDVFQALAKQKLPDLILLDELCCEDVLEYLSQLREKHPDLSIYLLTSRFDLQTISELKDFPSVKGIILKSLNQEGILNLLENLNVQK